MSSLKSMVKAFSGTQNQIAAIKWFQASTGDAKRSQFALIWRSQREGDEIDFVNVFRYYEGTTDQDAALKWLEDNSQPRTLTEFNRLWSLPSPASIKLGVPYFQQVDNRHEPMRTCNTSSCAMVAKFLGANISGDDDYYQIVRKYGDTTDHGAQTRALREIGVQSTWRRDLGFADLDDSLLKGRPIVIGILHRGPLTAPTGGHMIVIIGQRGRDYIAHDPFGSLLDPGGAYSGAVTNGNGVVYPRDMLTRRWLPEGDRSGWGRLFLPTPQY